MNFYHSGFMGAVGHDYPNDMYMLTDVKEPVCKVCKRKPKYVLIHYQNNNTDIEWLCGYHKGEKQ